MIEVVFSRSAYGARKVGLSKQHDGHSVVLVFELALDMGPIDAEVFGLQRRQVLAQLCTAGGGDLEQVDYMLSYAKECWQFLEKRADQEAPIRIWVSEQPGEACGMVWLLSKLDEIDYTGEITIVPMPAWEYTEEGDVERKNGWGETEEWGSYVSFRQTVNKAFRSGCAQKWEQMRKENAPVRVMLNGRLTGIGSDVYDYAIDRAIDAQPKEFMQADVVLAVLHQYLGIGDAWVALRIEERISAGELAVVREAPEGEPIHRRMLKKIRK